MSYVLFASYGNDSIALIQHAHEIGLQDLTVIYSDTGWASSSWYERVSQAETWAQTLGFRTARTKSIGLEQLVRDRKGWPRQGIQFCTKYLKIEPGAEALEQYDPDKLAICMIGVRRAESANRSAFQEWTEFSPNHGGRKLWAPLVHMSDDERNALIVRAGFEVLPHRSHECFPCVNSNRMDIRMLAEDDARVQQIEDLEKDLGLTSKGKPRTMFRPYRYMGATGIREVVRWAQSDRGKFDKLDDGTGDGAACDPGWCGT